MYIPHLLFLVFAKIFFFFGSAQSEVLQYPVIPGDIKCNGFNLLCDRQFNRIVSVMTRSSFAVENKLNGLVGSQTMGIVDQLNSGVRGLHLNLFPDQSNASQVRLCMGDCTLYDGGPLTDTLNTIFEWLSNNPREVLTILLDNASNVSTGLINSAFTSSKLLPMVYNKTIGQGWATLREMITSNKRIVVLEDSSRNLAQNLPWVFNYDVNTLRSSPTSDYENGVWSCFDYGDSGSKTMFIVSHYNTFDTQVVNSVSYSQIIPKKTVRMDLVNGDYLVEHAMNCKTTHAFYYMTALMVDFYSPGYIDTMLRGFNAVDQPNDSYKNYVPDFKKQAVALPSTASQTLAPFISLLSICLTLLCINLISL